MRICLAVIVLSLLFTNSYANQLKNHPSPYLALHGNDPVNWMEWGQESLTKAVAENKPIFISIGYFSCHWCHVMQRESFADTAVAEELNENYISIKVDREMNPVLDKRLIDFVQSTIGHAGWPLNVILTPEAYPLTGATYLPKEHFQNALVRLAELWDTDGTQMQIDALDLHRQLAEARRQSDRSGRLKTVADNRQRFLDVAMQMADSLQGGFGQQNKFPMVMQLRALMELNRREGRQDINEFVQLTLNQMQTNGLNDVISGGFFRYTVDPDWETPHFEKMLYTSAMLTELYIDAWRQYGKSGYRDTAVKTLDFIRDVMQSDKEAGAYISSLSAVDDKNVEGGYYLFDQETLKLILNDSELAFANSALALDRPAVLPDGILPLSGKVVGTLAKEFKLSHEAVHNQLALIKTKLQSWRAKNRHVPEDDKLLAGWNGLVLSSFASAYDIHPDSRVDGHKLVNFIQSLVKGDVLFRSAERTSEATMGGYASVSLGLLRWGKVADDSKATALGEKLLSRAWELFHSAQGWLESDASLLPGDYRQQHIADSSLPSPETQLLQATELLDDQADNHQWMKLKLADILSRSTLGIEHNPFIYPSLIAFSAQ